MVDARHARGFGAQDHVSWPFDDRAEFRARVGEFLGEGLDLGLRCLYTAEGPRERLEADLVDVPHVEDHLRSGAIVVRELGELYAEGEPIDPGATLAAFVAATEEALALGYAGLRGAGDSTSLVRSPEQVAAFAEWEHLADRYMSEHPLSALCAFDRRELPTSATTTLACLHPSAREGATPFHVYSPGGDADLAIAGELDVAVADEFRTCLLRTGLEDTPELVVDGTRLEFVDHRALLTIRDLARRLGATVLLRTSSSTPGRLIELLRLDGIRAVRVPVVA